MKRAVVCPPIRRRPLFRGGGGSPALHPLILKQSTISTVAAGHAMKIPHKRPAWTGERLPSPTHSRRRTKHHHALACIGLTHSSRHSKPILGN
ncbi:Hypothetical protein FKW44_010672 [Caligus rogercresseyi]|uniref:Uncharacterized protein n=1 Tax=Caligus rogercresseyi TaxID=217165 RepID=A0A7T8HGX0_CALRO|nr:Hypothetical protein FKW44_010672 [Caligus rogercresseyi]